MQSLSDIKIRHPSADQTDWEEMWEHAEQHQWSIDSIFAHCFRLGDTLCSTKELIEDAFGHAADAKRANKNPLKSLAPERFHLNTSLWGRLDRDEWPKLGTELDDFGSTKGSTFSRRCNIATFAPASTVLKTFNAACLKKPGYDVQKMVHMCCFKIRTHFSSTD